MPGYDRCCPYGTRALTLAEHNLERHWRRLHDPVRWKYAIIGNYRLNGVTPPLHGMELVKARCRMSRRDGAIVAWHEVPGTAPPQKSRPVGYGLIRAGVRADSMIEVMKFRMRKL